MHPPLLHDEQILLQQIAQGDEGAFSTLFHAYLGNLQPFIMSLTRSIVDTEEIIQETFVRIWMNRDKLPEIRILHAWIYTIAANECYKFLQKKSRLANGLSGLAAAAVGKEDQSTMETLQLKEMNRLIAEAVRLLPLQRRRIYLLSRDEGMKIPEIAAALKLSPNTVKNTLVISLGFIRKYLRDKGQDL